MDFLNQSFAQLKDLFQSMTPAARITAALLLAVVVISLAYLFTHEVAGPDVYLLGGEMFPSSEINNMTVAFSQEGLDSYEVEGNKIRIPRGQREQYMAALAKHNALPEQYDDILTRTLDQGTAFMSPTEREARLKAGREKYLSRTLSAWPEIERAYVTYDSKKRGGLARDPMVNALVQVKPRGNTTLSDHLTSSIRRAVRNAIPGLKPENCAVSDMNTGRTTVGSSDHQTSPEQDAYIARQRYYEEKYRSQIVDALGIPGATVMAFAELDRQKLHQEEAIKHDSKTVTVHTSETTSERTVESKQPAGRVGFIAQNKAAALNTAAAQGNSETETQSESSQESLPSTTKTVTETAGLTLKRVAVTVTVPTSYYEQVWRRDNLPEEGEEPKRPEESDLQPIRTRMEAEIKQVVAKIIPPPEDGTDPQELVHVAELPNLAPPSLPQPGLADNAFAWLGSYWSTLGLIALAFFSLLILRSMVRAAPASATKARAPKGALRETEQAEEISSQDAAQRKLQPFSGSGASLRDELSDLVNEDPDTAANILRNWIGTAT
jgi:flagellar M-ring protein FliF